MCLTRRPWISNALIQPTSSPPPLSAVRLPGGGSVVREGSIEISHRFRCGLLGRTWEESSNLLAVPFDHDLLALDGQPVQYPAQIARQVGCSNSLQLFTSMRKIRLNQILPQAVAQSQAQFALLCGFPPCRRC